jgi:4-hydroxyacetophenone monooxygenase
MAMEEVTVRFALEAIGGLIEAGQQAVEVTEDAYWRYNAVIDDAERLMTYVDPRANNYYQNEFGRSATNGPIDTRPDPAGRRTAGAPLTIDESLLPQYEALDPHFGADLIVS